MNFRYILGVLAVIAMVAMVVGWSTPKACVPVTVPANTSAECIVGGAICAASEGQHCSGTWPFRKHCTTTYTISGSCGCVCK